MTDAEQRWVLLIAFIAFVLILCAAIVVDGVARDLARILARRRHAATRNTAAAPTRPRSHR